MRILLVVWLMTLAGSAAAQCCGDCNDDGTVSINELVSAVTRALDGCSSQPTAKVVLSNVTLPTFSVTINPEITAGSVSLTLESQSLSEELSSLVMISNPNPASPRATLLVNGQFLRWVVTDVSGHESDISVRNAAGFFGTHRIAVNWDRDSTAIAIDGVENSAAVDNPSLPAGSTLTIGSAAASGIVFHDVSFAIPQ